LEENKHYAKPTQKSNTTAAAEADAGGNASGQQQIRAGA